MTTFTGWPSQPGDVNTTQLSLADQPTQPAWPATRHGPQQGQIVLILFHKILQIYFDLKRVIVFQINKHFISYITISPSN